MTTTSRYPNRDAIRRALDIYIDAMRPFVVRCLRPTSAEGLRAAIVSYLNPGQQQNFADAIARQGGNIPAAIDIGILRTLINAAWFDHFRSEFKYTDTVRSAVNFITETRNEESHMGLGDHDAGRAYVCLYHITTVLKHTGNTDACRAVADLMTQIAPQRRPASSPAAANTDTAADTDTDPNASADPPSAVSPADLAQALRQAETREAEARQAIAQADAREQAAHHAVRQMETRAAETETCRQDAEQAIAQADARAQTAEQAIAETETRRQDAEQAIAQADARAQTAEQAIRTAQERANAADAREHAARQALEQAEAREAEARQAIAEAQTREQDAEQAIAEAEAYEQDVEQAIRAADERAQAAIRALRQAETREAEARHAIARANALRQDAEQAIRTVAARTPVPGTLAPGTPEPARAAVAASHPAAAVAAAVADADAPASAAPVAPRTDALLPPDAPLPPPSPAALPRCWQAVLDDLSRTRGQKYYLGAVLKDCPPPAVRIVGDHTSGAGDRNSGSDRPTLILPFASRPGLYRMLEELSLSHCGGVIARAIAANFGAPCAFAITLQNETPQREYYRYTP